MPVPTMTTGEAQRNRKMPLGCAWVRRSAHGRCAAMGFDDEPGDCRCRPQGHGSRIAAGRSHRATRAASRNWLRYDLSGGNRVACGRTHRRGGAAGHPLWDLARPHQSLGGDGFAASPDADAGGAGDRPLGAGLRLQQADHAQWQWTQCAGPRMCAHPAPP
jgi:hypothetical protein